MINHQNNSFNEDIMTAGTTYTVGTNDGKQIEDVIFVGTKQFNGKSIMCFETYDRHEIRVNPSYFSFSVEKGTEMHSITDEQAKEKSWVK